MTSQSLSRVDKLNRAFRGVVDVVDLAGDELPSSVRTAPASSRTFYESEVIGGSGDGQVDIAVE